MILLARARVSAAALTAGRHPGRPPGKVSARPGVCARSVAQLIRRLSPAATATDARHDAVEGLKRMKKFAEAATLPMLQSSNSEARQQACEVLGEVGGRKSFDALTAFVAKTGEHGFEGFAAKIALDKVKQRLALQPEGSN